MTGSNWRQQAFVALVAAVASTAAAQAADRAFAGTRSNITPGGVMGGRCAPAITVNFGPNAFAASGTSNFGNFTYEASHCIATPPPGSYYDGLFTWTLADGTLTGTHSGTLSFLAPGQFSVLENLLFTGGTGRYAGATGNVVATGVLSFGLFQGTPASFSEASFTGTLNAPGVPEPASWAMLLAGFGLVGSLTRRQRQARPA